MLPIGASCLLAWQSSALTRRCGAASRLGGGNSTTNGSSHYKDVTCLFLTDEDRTCTLHGRILSLKQDATHLHYKVTWPAHQAEIPSFKDDTEDLLRHYFSLNIDLASLYQQWSKDDPNFRKKAPQFTGVRILNQDAWEALICFICSSNNNISRISQMVSRYEEIHPGMLLLTRNELRPTSSANTMAR